jgi:hypothetical protein
VTLNEIESLRLLVVEVGTRTLIAALVVWAPWLVYALKLRILRLRPHA